MARVAALNAKNDLLSRASALGNSKKSLVNVASDLVNSYGQDKESRQRLANGTFLSSTTLDRISTLKETDTGSPYRPQVDTIERILKFFGAQVHFSTVAIRGNYQNKPKD